MGGIASLLTQSMVLAQTLLHEGLCGNVLECCAHPCSTQRRLSGGACGTKPTAPRSRCFRSELLCLNGFASVRRPQSTPSASVQCPPHCTWPGYFLFHPTLVADLPHGRFLFQESYATSPTPCGPRDSYPM